MHKANKMVHSRTIGYSCHPFFNHGTSLHIYRKSLHSDINFQQLNSIMQQKIVLLENIWWRHIGAKSAFNMFNVKKSLSIKWCTFGVLSSSFIFIWFRFSSCHWCIRFVPTRNIRPHWWDSLVWLYDGQPNRLKATCPLIMVSSSLTVQDFRLSSKR